MPSLMTDRDIAAVLRDAAAELRRRAKDVRKTDDFRALILSRECDDHALEIEPRDLDAPHLLPEDFAV